MDLAQYVVRRANVDDLPGLKTLWERASLQVLDLERRLTEFQLVSSLQGDLVGAAGLHVVGREGLLHSEAFAAPETEEAFRPLLWNRLHTLARNHGLLRLWTREAAPFWHLQAGFKEATPELLAKLPAVFGDRHVRWQVLALREETQEAVSFEKEFEMFQQTSRANMEQVMSQARSLRSFAYAIGIAFFLAALGWAAWIFVRRAGEDSPSGPTPR